jgi:hypothetical protein
MPLSETERIRAAAAAHDAERLANFHYAHAGRMAGLNTKNSRFWYCSSHGKLFNPIRDPNCVGTDGFSV